MTPRTSLLQPAAFGFFRCCYRCKANLGLARFAKKYELCPECRTVLNPKAMWLGPNEGTIIEDYVRQGRGHMYARGVGFLAIMGIPTGADKVTLQPSVEEYRLALSIDDQTFRLCPPPPDVQQLFPNVMRAIAGMDVADCNSAQRAELVIKQFENSPRSWPAIVTISPGVYGECIAFEYPEKGEANFELVKTFMEPCPEYVPEN